MTERTPDVRLSEANKESNEWTPGHFKLEFAKKVSNPRDKETRLHALLASKRVHGKEFFDISRDELIGYFGLMDGEMWIPTVKSAYKISSRNLIHRIQLIDGWQDCKYNGKGIWVPINNAPNLAPQTAES